MARQQNTVVTLLWLWWKERNRWREEGWRRAGRDLAYLVAAKTELKKTTEPTLLSDFHQSKKWQKPDARKMKINSDGAFVQETGEGAWGYAIRDDEGAVRKAGAGHVDVLQGAFHAELLGCLKGLKMASELGLHDVILETDAQMVKVAIEGDEYRLSSLGGIITEIQHLISREFSSCVFVHCPHDCNKLAHEFAYLGRILPGDERVTWDIVPQNLEVLVSIDVAVTAE